MTVFAIVWVLGLVAMVFGTLDAAMRPDSAWAEIDQSKVVWVAVIIFLPIAGAIAYFVAIRPKLVAV